MEIPYDLNPEAKGIKMQEYLHSSLKDDTEKKTQEKIRGLKQLIEEIGIRLRQKYPELKQKKKTSINKLALVKLCTNSN